jgi:hypothetical protein
MPGSPLDQIESAKALFVHLEFVRFILSLSLVIVADMSGGIFQSAGHDLENLS